jgi:DNA repair protein RadC
MAKIKDLPLHKRPREKLSEKGAENLSDSELLAILIRTGRANRSALDIAKDTLKKYPLSKLLAVSKDDLVSIKGLEETKAVTIKAALELGQRAANSFSDALPILDSPKVIVAQLADLRDKHKEYFMALYLNARNQLIHKETISVGTLTASLVHPREVFEPAIRHFASSVVLAHNHPSNNPEPSEEDVQLTENLVRAGVILDIALLDHIIITSNGYTSFKEKGLFF